MSRIFKIAITGPDGSGKSTVCSALCDRLSKNESVNSIQEVSIWNALSDPHATLFPSREATEKYLTTLGNDSRPLFIFHALARAYEQAMKKFTTETDLAQILLLNGYWYKYAVSELGYGVSKKNVFGAVECFSAPDLVFCLDVDPETSWLRKNKTTVYEQGGDTSNSKKSFLTFQKSLKTYWDAIEDESFKREHRKWIHISALHSAEETVLEIETALLQRIHERCQ